MKCVHFFICLLLLASFQLLADASKDSLEIILQNDQPLAEKHEAILALAKEINWSAPKRALSLVDTLRSLSIYQTDSSNIMALNAIQAKALRGTGNYPESIALYKKNYDYYLRHLDSLGMGTAAGQIGLMNTFNGVMLEGQEWLLRSHEIFQKVGSASDRAGANNALAIFYMGMEQREKGFDRYLQALEEYKLANDTLGEANVNANLGLAYIEDREFEKAEFHLLQQGHLDSLLDTKWGLGFFHDFMGYLRQEEGNFAAAYDYYNTALSIRKKLDSHYNIAESRVSLARMALELEKFEEAVFQAKKVFDHQDKSKSLSQQQSAYEVLSDSYDAMGKKALALQAHKDYKMISDSILNRDMLEKITEKDGLFKKAEQESEIALLNARNDAAAKLLASQRRTIIIGGIALVLISVLSFFLWQLYNKVKRQNVLISKNLEEKKLLLKEIHHRVKNNLQIISSLLNLQSKNIKDKKVAAAIQEGKTRVRSMALIHQDLYQQENLLGVSVRSYLNKLCRELFSTYRVNDAQINLDLEIEDIDLEVETLVPLGLILNELITNSIKYAFPNERDGTIGIKLYEADKKLVLRVADDGVGMNFEEVQKNKSFGHFLIKTLSKQLQGKYELKGEAGTVFEMVIGKYKVAS